MTASPLRTSIVGSDLRLVERVTGRLTRGRAAGAGALTGLWAGLLIGLFTSGHSVLAVIAAGAVFGAVWGAVFGYAAHAATRGRRDFSSVRMLPAGRYDLIARGGTVQRVRSMLGDAGLLPDESVAD
jgi:hypothetical protein